jgi:hypothetical protein
MTACERTAPAPIARDLPPWQVHLMAAKHLKRRLELNVYLVVLSHQGRNDWAYPSDETIAGEISTPGDEIKKRRVNQIIRTLEKAGWLETRRRGRGATSLKRCLVPGAVYGEFKESRAERDSRADETRMPSEDSHPANRESRSGRGSQVPTAQVRNGTSTKRASGKKIRVEQEASGDEGRGTGDVAERIGTERPDLWEAIKAELRKSVPAAFFRAFIDPCSLFLLDDGDHCLEVPDSMSVAHFEDRYLPAVADALRGIVPGTSLRVRVRLRDCA